MNVISQKQFGIKTKIILIQTFYTWIFVRKLKSPNTLRSQMIRITTTTIFKMFLIFRSIGMNELTTHSRTPTMIITSKIDNSGIINDFKR